MVPERVWVVRSYPDLTRFRRTAGNPRLKRDRPYLVGYVGIMAEQDGVDILVRAMAHIVHELSDDTVSCLIIGDGPELERLKSLAEEIGVADHVTFTGFLSGERLMENLSSLDLGVIPDPPNACNDKLSMNKVFEYMALGLPFVQFDLKQARKEAGKAALVVTGNTAADLAAGIVGLLADKDRRTEMGTYGARHAQREFQWRNECRALLDAYRTILADRKILNAAE